MGTMGHTRRTLRVKPLRTLSVRAGLHAFSVFWCGWLLAGAAELNA